MQPPTPRPHTTVLALVAAVIGFGSCGVVDAWTQRDQIGFAAGHLFSMLIGGLTTAILFIALDRLFDGMSRAKSRASSTQEPFGETTSVARARSGGSTGALDVFKIVLVLFTGIIASFVGWLFSLGTSDPFSYFLQGAYGGLLIGFLIALPVAAIAALIVWLFNPRR